jgi:tetratricopeptide (TPR) repeat protein
MRPTALGERGSIPLAVVILMSLTSVALAGPTEEAREETRRGTAAYNLGDFEEAAHRYESAYRLISDPALLFNVGQAWRQAGRPEKALLAYKAYLRTAPANAPNREQVSRRVGELERVVSETRRLQSAPPPGTLGPPHEGIEAAPALERQAAAPDAAVVAPPAPEPQPLYKRWYFWAGVGAVVAGAVVTSVVLASGARRSTTCGTGLDYCVPVRP